MTAFALRRRPRSRVPLFESLERREVLASALATLDAGLLNVLGTNKNDAIRIDLELDQLRVVVNKLTYQFNVADVTSLSINALAGNDRVQVSDAVLVNAAINGGRGNDQLRGGGGNDTLVGDAGNDKLDGGLGNDVVFGDAGHDRLVGGEGNDTLNGGAGHDHLRGDAGDDVLSGEAGHDLLWGGDGLDQLFGAEGNDHLRGGADDDFLDGGDGRDHLRGEDGSDKLKGGLGNDHLDGGDGENLLDGDEGRNKLKNGVETDLDVQPPPDNPQESLSAFLSSESGSSAYLTYGEEVGQSSLESVLRIDVMNATPGESLHVIINGVSIGHVLIGGNRFGSLIFTSNPDEEGELLLPPGLQITAGTSIVIGLELSGTFTAAESN